MVLKLPFFLIVQQTPRIHLLCLLDYQPKMGMYFLVSIKIEILTCILPFYRRIFAEFERVKGGFHQFEVPREILRFSSGRGSRRRFVGFDEEGHF